METSKDGCWKNIRKITKTTKPIQCLINEQDTILITDKEISCELANYYEKQFTPVGAITQDENSAPKSTNYNNILTHTTPKEVKNVIRTSANRKTPGVDKITNRMLKNLPTKWIVHITNIFNAALRLKYFPTPWKQAIIAPIPKEPDINRASDTRPISLLSSLSKIFERIVLSRLKGYLDEREFLTPDQFGFRQGHSTVNQLQNIIEFIQERRNNSEGVGAVLIDFSKAFDKVNHDKLMEKLHKYNFPCDFIKFTNTHTFISETGTSKLSLTVHCHRISQSYQE